MRKSVCAGLLLAIALALGGCSREKSDWHAARVADTIEAYDQFIAKHPDGELATQARARSSELTEERDWQRVTKADTLDEYRQFLTQHPNGKWAQEAKVRIENFAVAGGQTTGASAEAPGTSAPAAAAAPPTAAPKAARAATSAPLKAARPKTTAAKTTPSKKSAASAASAHAPKAPAAGGGSTAAVQLGAFSSHARADGEWARLKRKFAGDLGALAPRIAEGSSAHGTVYRLQAAVGSRADAQALCTRLQARHQACLVLKR